MVGAVLVARHPRRHRRSTVALASSPVGSHPGSAGEFLISTLTPIPAITPKAASSLGTEIGTSW